jgi:peptide deformylase
MMEILKWPDPRLTAPNAQLEGFGPDERAKVDGMVRLMLGGNGVGLAAPQVGWNARLFMLAIGAVKIDGTAAQFKPLVFFNPEIETYGEKELRPEGCLSFPGIFAKVERWSHARLKADTPDGRTEIRFIGFAAQAVQHEFDHLDGILFIDRLSPEERSRIEPELEALRMVQKD